MDGEDKTKEQLIEESGKMRQRLTELETLGTERKKAEEELREARGYLENLINYANVPIIVWDKEFRITRFNHAFEYFTGYVANEVTGQELRMLFPEASRDESLSKIERTLGGEYWKSVEIPILCKDGNIKLALWNSANIYDRDGTTLLATIAQGIDISERKKTEEELKESEGKHRTLYETIKDGIAGGTMDGRVLECNQAFADMLGYSKDELKNLTYQQLTPERWHQMEANIVEEQVLKRGYSDEYEKEYIKKDGTVFPISAKVWLARDKDGKSAGMWGIVRDISERKQAEEKLRLYGEITTNMSEGVYVIRASDGVIIYANPKFEEMFGYDPGELIGKHVYIVNAPTDKSPEETAKEIIEVLNKNGLWRGEIYNIKKDGTAFWCYAGVSVIEHPKHGKVWVSMHTDITERKQMESNLWKRTHDLGERVKELNCLFGISQLVEKAGISLEEIFQGTVGLIPYSCQYPEITCARIILEGREFKTENFRETIWKQASDIIVHGKPIGSVEVCLLEEKPESDEGPFLKEERSLLNAISERLGRITERKRAEETLEKVNKCLLSFGHNPDENIKKIIETTASILHGTCVLYNKEKGPFLCTVKGWNVPEDFKREDNKEGHICLDVITNYKDEPFIVYNLDKTPYAETDINVTKYKLKTYIGCAVKVLGRAIGSLCIVYQQDKIFSVNEIKILSILTKALGIEEERRQEEETLQEYRKAVESSQEMIAVLDRQYVYCLANEAFMRYRGLNRDQVVGHTVTELVGEDAFETKVKPNFDRCLGGENVRFEMVYEDPQAGNRDLQVSYYPLRDDEEEVTGVVAILRDITLEKKIERKRECLIKLFQLLNKAVSLKETMQGAIHFLKDCSGCDSIGIRLREGDDFPYFQTEGFPEEFVRMGNSLCIRDGDGQIVRDDTGNPVWECMCGSVILGRFDHAKPFFTENGSFWTNSISKLLASTTEADRQLWMRNKCNVKGYESVAFVPLRTEIEAFGLLQLNYRREGQFVPFDITFLEMVGKYLATWLARKQAEKALWDSERNYRLLAENVQDIIWTTDMNFKFTYISPSVRRVRGYSVEEAMAQTLEERLTPASLEVIRKALAEELAIEEMEQKDLFRSRMLQLELIRKDGFTVCTESMVSFLRDQDGRAVGILGVTRDISERKKMEQEILKFSKLESVGILAGGIAHDFNNFLMAILGNISVAKMYTEPGDKISERLTDAEKASMRAKDLTKQLLIFSHGGEPIKKIVSIGELIKDAALFALRGSNVRCQFSIPADLWPVDVDEGQISQVINNLVINADQAMPEGGIIEVCAENSTIDANYGFPVKEGEYIKISIKDQGVGIPEEHLPKIFDPYFTTKQKGSGLGLATTYSIIKNHQGYITLESKTREGTTFYVYLPASSKEVLTKKEEEEKIFAGSGKILVVDDEKMVRDVTGNMLKLIGYESESAGDGVEAVEVYKKAKESQQSFNAIILDLTIPGTMGGAETIKKLIEIDPEVKAIVCSGYSNDPVMANFRQYGFSGFLVKPYRVEELNEILHKVMTGKNE